LFSPPHLAIPPHFEDQKTIQSQPIPVSKTEEIQSKIFRHPGKLQGKFFWCGGFGKEEKEGFQKGSIFSIKTTRVALPITPIQ